MVRAQEAGADDHVTRPFRVAVLRVRMQAAMRHGQPALAPERLVHSELAPDLATRLATRRGQTVVPAPTEFRLQHPLSAQPGCVFTGEEVVDALWGHCAQVDPRTLDVHARTFVMTMKEPHGPLLNLLSELWIVAPESEGWAQTIRPPIGTGPFRFGTWTPNVSFLAPAFEQYWQLGLPCAAAAEFNLRDTDDLSLTLRAEDGASPQVMTTPCTAYARALVASMPRRPMDPQRAT